MMHYVFRKLRTVVVNRVIRFIHDRSQKEPESFGKFYTDYGIFIKEGILTEVEHVIKVKLNYTQVVSIVFCAVRFIWLICC